MFTDDAVTPVRLEILVDLLRNSRGGFSREDTYRLLQPKSLDPNPQFIPAKATVRAALELGLAEENAETLFLSKSSKREKDTRSAILKAFDERALANSDVERYFSLFYAYYIGLGKKVYTRRSQENQKWADQFNEVVFDGKLPDNAFNGTKLTGLHRWLSYVGLGWYDPAGTFQANPYERLVRAFPSIFTENRKLSSDEFMVGLAEACPELDGGATFQQANREWKRSDKQCSLGLSHALIELHEDGVIQLDCPADCQEWSLKEAEPPRDDWFKGDRFATIEWRKE